MAINVADNFSYKGSKPLDARIKYETVAAMAGAATADLYDGCLTYVAATKKYYSYDSSNTTDPTTGKWREYSSGGGGTEYTAGDGIIIEDGEISTDNMPSADMSEIVTPLPGVMSRRRIYSPEEQVVGEWREYVSGVLKKKPVYEKYVSLTISTSGWNSFLHGIQDIDNPVNINAYIRNTVSHNIYTIGATTSDDVMMGYFSRTEVSINARGFNDGSIIAVIQYTKTTDEWEVI